LMEEPARDAARVSTPALWPVWLGGFRLTLYNQGFGIKPGRVKRLWHESVISAARGHSSGTLSATPTT